MRDLSKLLGGIALLGLVAAAPARRRRRRYIGGRLGRASTRIPHHLHCYTAG